MKLMGNRPPILIVTSRFPGTKWRLTRQSEAIAYGLHDFRYGIKNPPQIGGQLIGQDYCYRGAFTEGISGTT